MSPNWYLSTRAIPFLSKHNRLPGLPSLFDPARISPQMTLLRLLCLIGTLSACIPAFPNSTWSAQIRPHSVRNSVREVRVLDDRKILALTFDLCEGPGKASGFDSALVDFLTRNSVNATFFAGGKWMRSHPEETMRLMADPLFEIGNHSWNHANFRQLDPAAAKDQITRTLEEYNRIRNLLVARLEAEGADRKRTSDIPQPPNLFRFPYGACTGESLAVLAELDMTAIQWNIVSGDPARGRTSEGIVNTVLSQVKPGSIVIFHANGRGRGTLGALRVLVPKLRNQGYEFVTVGELLALGTPVAVPECYELKPGDTLRYDNPPLKKKTASSPQEAQ
jgi:peptidoglycan/xylan/chitin deacetylase (PgdA/CDA1 family)